MNSKGENANVRIERNAAKEPQAVVVRFTPEQAETLQVGWLTAQTMLAGFIEHMKGDQEGEAKATQFIKQGLSIMLGDAGAVGSVYDLLKEVHMQMCHNGDREAHGEDEEPQQNWRCN